MHLRVKLLMAAMLILLIAGSGCSKEEPVIEGWVYWVEDSQFLVVDGIESVDVPYDEWFETGEHAAIVFTTVPRTRFRMGNRYGGLADLEVGQRVRVWADGGIALSYPGQATAVRVEILDEI